MKALSILQERITLQYHETLNQKLWRNDKLIPIVRNKLLAFAKAWQQFSEIPEHAVIDIIMTGGNANFNYTPQSDIDVHIVIDKDKIHKNNPLLDDVLYSKKLLWTLTHNVTVYGYPLEPYAQDKVEKYPRGQGVYSLKRDTWVQKPVNLHLDFKNNKHLDRKVKYYKRVIDEMINHKMDVSAFENFKKKLSNMRGAGIAKHGEFSFENLVFKELRNTGYLNKMNAYEKSLQDKALSL